jgi:hypothetical protein
MTQTLEGTTATGRSLGRRVAARPGGSAIGTIAQITTPSRPRGEAVAS